MRKLLNSRKVLPNINWTKITVRTASFILLITAMFSVYLMLFPESLQLSKLTNQILYDPFDPKPHLNLAEYYINTGNKGAAMKEMELAYHLGSEEVVTFYKNIITKNSNLIEEENYWDSIAKKNPTYIDAYLNLASIQRQLGMSAKAKEHLERAYKIDPNHPIVQKLQTQIN